MRALFTAFLVCWSLTLFGDLPEGDYVVVFQGRENPRDVARDHGVGIKKGWTNAVHGFSAHLNANQASKLERDTRVQVIEPDITVHTCAQATPTGVRRIGCQSNTRWVSSSTTPIDVDIAILDSGIDLTHPDLNVYTNVTYVSGTTTGNDDAGHGTHCAGIAAAKNNSIGVVGVAPGARLWAVKVLDSTGSGTMSGIISGVDYVTQHASEIEVASMSLGGLGSVQSLRLAIQNSVAQGVVYVVAAGNSAGDIFGGDWVFGTSDDFIPASYPEVMTVSALADSDGIAGGTGLYTTYGPDDSLATFSNYSRTSPPDNPVFSPGAGIDVAAPGVNIYSTYKDGGYSTMSGTSMACPHVAGAVALYIAKNGRANSAAEVAAIRQAIIDLSIPQTAWGVNPTTPLVNDNKNEGLVDVTQFEGNTPATGRPPVVSITAPTSGASYDSTNSVTFVGVANDLEDGSLTASIVWSSSIDGAIGTGGTITHALTVGTHTVSARVTDSNSNSAFTATTVIVTSAANAPPTVTITSPATGTHYSSGATVTFVGSATDVIDGNLSARIAWTVSGNPIGNGSTVSSIFPDGNYTVVAKVTDSGYKSATNSVAITVGTASVNAPTVTISSPITGSSSASGTPIQFTGSAVDVEDGYLTRYINWSSSLSGSIGVGGNISAPLNIGTHVITAKATDSSAMTGSATVSITVTNTLNPPTNYPPAVVISYPAEGATFPEGSSVTVSSTATDSEDGDKTSSIQVSDNLNGVIGSGGSVLFFPSVGNHTVTAYVIDSGGLSDTATISFSVYARQTNAPPSIFITAPVNNYTVVSNTAVTFSATATDAEDGTLVPSWYNSLSGVLGSGASLITTLTNIGTNLITASATDSGGLVAQAQVSVIVTNAVVMPNTYPVVLLTVPTNGLTVTTGTTVIYAGSATDSEDGALVVTWVDSIAGLLGTGNTGAYVPAVGTHTLTASGTDTQGATSSKSVLVQVNNTNSLPSQLTVALVTDRTTYVNKQKAKITATVTCNGAAVVGATCAFAIRGASGSSQSKTVTTTTGGVASFYVPINKAKLGTGVATVTVNATKSGYYSATKSTTFTIL